MKREKGQTTIEYIILIAVLSIALLFVIGYWTGVFKSAVDNLSNELATKLTDSSVR